MFEFYQRNYPTGQRGNHGSHAKKTVNPAISAQCLRATRKTVPFSDSGKLTDSFCDLGVAEHA